MRWPSVILILIGGLHLILQLFEQDLKIMRIFGEYENVAAVTILVAGVLILLLTFMKSNGPAHQSMTEENREE